MKIKIWISNGVTMATHVIDTDVLGFPGSDWEEQSEDDRMDAIVDWAFANGMEVGYEEVE